jgi:hypothetical protein
MHARGELGQRDHPPLHLAAADLHASGMGFFPQPQRVVIDHTRAAEHPGELHLLPRRGTQAVTVSDQHGTGIYTRPQTATGDYRRGRHVVSALPVHLVFVRKCRRSVPAGEHIQFLAEVFG